MKLEFFKNKESAKKRRHNLRDNVAITKTNLNLVILLKIWSVVKLIKNIDHTKILEVLEY